MTATMVPKGSVHRSAPTSTRAQSPKLSGVHPSTLLTAVMIHEKTRPAGARAVPVTGVALLAAASVVLAYSAVAAAAA